MKFFLMNQFIEATAYSYWNLLNGSLRFLLYLAHLIKQSCLDLDAKSNVLPILKIVLQNCVGFSKDFLSCVSETIEK
jgi:hypothetical protein